MSCSTSGACEIFVLFFFIGMIDAHNRCDQAGENGITRLAGVRCPQGLSFDIDRQTCDWKSRVKNCDKLDSKYDERLDIEDGLRALNAIYIQNNTYLLYTV